MTRDKDRLTVAPDYEKSGACGKGGDIERARLSGKPPILAAPYGKPERRGADRPFSKVLMASVQSGKSVSMGDLVRGTQTDAFVIGPDGERVFLDIKTGPSLERESKRRIWRALLWAGTLALYTGLAFGIAFALFYSGARTVA